MNYSCRRGLVELLPMKRQPHVTVIARPISAWQVAAALPLHGSELHHSVSDFIRPLMSLGANERGAVQRCGGERTKRGEDSERWMEGCKEKMNK